MAGKKKGKGGARKYPGGRPPAKNQAKPKSPSSPTGEAAAPAAAPAQKAPKLTQQQRIEAARRERLKNSRRTRAIVSVAIAAVVLGVAVTAINNRRSASSRVSALEASGACEFDRKHDRLQPPPNNHVPPGSYSVNPPAGGDHDPSPSPAGDFSASASEAPRDANIVHSLEHGYIAIWYQPSLGAEDLEKLRAVYREYERDVLLVPRASLPVPVAATAWERRLLCSRTDADALERFVTAYRNQGPEKVPH